MTTKTNPLSNSAPWGVRLLLLGGTALVASSFHVVAAIATDLPPMKLAFLRFALASALFAPVVFWRHGFKFPPFRDLGRYALQSLCLTVFFTAMFQALRHTSALNTGALYTLVPGLTGIFSYLLSREKLGVKKTIALLAAMLGALSVVAGGDLRALSGLRFNQGDLIFLLGCVFMGFYGPIVRRFYKGEPMLVLTFWTLITACGWLLLFSGDPLSLLNWKEIRMPTFLGIAYLAIFCTFITFLIFQWGILQAGAAETSAYSYLTPAFVLGGGYLLGRGAPHWSVLISIVFIAGAMLILQTSNKQVQKKQDKV